MQVTCLHSASKKGLPVILDDDGDVMPYAKGLTAILKYLQISRAQLAQMMGYKSARSIEKFWQGTTPPAYLLNILGKNIHMAKAYDELSILEDMIKDSPHLEAQTTDRINELRDITLWGNANQ